MRNPLLRERNRKEGRAGLRRGRAGPYSGAGVTARVLYSRLVALWAGGEGGGLGGQGRSRWIDLRVSRGRACGVRLRGEAARRRVGLAQVGWRRRVGFRRGGAAPWLWGGE